MKLLSVLRLGFALTGTVLLLAAPSAQGDTIRFHPFEVNADLVNPKGKLVEGPDGAFYGTAEFGGPNGTGFGDGYLFRVTASGTGSLLYPFANGSDGDAPAGALAVAPNGLLYGTGANGANGGNGVIYTIDTAGNFNVIHTLSSNETLEGAAPNGSLVLGPDADLFYGMTSAGGLNNNGIVYSVSLSGSFKKIRSFSALTSGTNPEGANPYGGLTFGDDGNLYGVAYSGGQFGNGTVFYIPTSGGPFTTVHSFSALGANDVNEDGANPVGELLKDSDGNFYGVAQGGGSSGYGVLYKITPSGNFSVIHNFTGQSDGALPINVTFGPGGSLWGTTEGGSFAGGSFFGIYPNHAQADFSFPGTTNPPGLTGDIINSGLVLGSDGNLYGTTNSDGADDNGTIFEIVLNRNSIQPFSTVAGRYYGLMNDGSGFASIDLAPSGRVSVRLLATEHFVFAGSFDSNTDQFAETLPRGGPTLSMQLQFVNNVPDITGVGNGSAFTAYRSAFDAGESPSNAGKYTAITTPNATLSGIAPAGYGSGLMTVTKTGNVTLAAKMGDGSLYHLGGLLLQADGFDEFAFYHSIYFYGILPFERTATYAVQTNINWGDAPRQNRYYPDGFTSQLNIDADTYVPPARGTPALPIIDGNIGFSGGGLAAGAFSATITINPNNTVTFVGANPNEIALHIDAAAGTFSGSFIGSYAGVTRPVRTVFTGVLYPAITEGAGGFLGPIQEGTDASGVVIIQP